MERSTADTKKISPVQALYRVVTSVTHDSLSRSPPGRSYMYERLPRPILWYRGKILKRRQLQMRRTKRLAYIKGDFFRSRASWF